MDRHDPDPALAAVGTAAGTGVLSYLAHVNWIGVFGLILSACWLVLAVFKELRERREKREAKAAKG